MIRTAVVTIGIIAFGIGAFSIGVAVWGHGTLTYLTATAIICGVIIAVDPANWRKP